MRACLTLLFAQNLPASEFEIIVADNNSAIGLEAVRVACGEHARVVHALIQGAAAARNAGIEASRGRILAFIVLVNHACCASRFRRVQQANTQQ